MLVHMLVKFYVSSWIKSFFVCKMNKFSFYSVSVFIPIYCQVDPLTQPGVVNPSFVYLANPFFQALNNR